MPPLKCLSHTKSGISYTCTLMSNLRYPLAAPPANPQLCFGRVTSFSISQFRGIFYCICILPLLFTKKIERNSKRHSPQPCLVSITFLRQSDYDCSYFCFMHAIAFQISPHYPNEYFFRVLLCSLC